MTANLLVTVEDCALFKHKEQCQTDTLKNNLNVQQCSPERQKHIVTSSALQGSPYEPSLLGSHLLQSLSTSLYEFHYSCA